MSDPSVYSWLLGIFSVTLAGGILAWFSRIERDIQHIPTLMVSMEVLKEEVKELRADVRGILERTK